MMSAKALLIMTAVLAGTLTISVSAQPAPPPQEPLLPNFISFSGIIERILRPETEDAGFIEAILVRDAQGSELAFRITENTFFLTDTKAETGADIIGFYDAKLPMILIYPPQPEAVVIAVGLEEGKFIKVDRFDENCSIAAIFREKHDEFIDLISGLLF